MLVLGPLVDVVHVVDPEVHRLHPLPSGRQPLPLEGVAPMGRVGVVVYVVLPASKGPVH